MLVTIQQVHLAVSIMNKLLSVIFLCVALSTLDAQIYQPNYKALYGLNGPANGPREPPFYPERGRLDLYGLNGPANGPREPPFYPERERLDLYGLNGPANGPREPPFYPERERLDLPEGYLHALRQRTPQSLNQANPEGIYSRGNIGVRSGSDDGDDGDNDDAKKEARKRVNLVLKLGTISNAAFKDVGDFLLSLSGDEGKSIFDLGNIRIFHQLINRATSAGLVIKDIIEYLVQDCMTLFHTITTNPLQILIFVLKELLKMIGLPPDLLTMVGGIAEGMLQNQL